MRNRTLLWAGIWLLLAWGRGAAAQSVAQVLVVINDNSPTSVAVGDYYVAARSIPATNVCHIHTVDSALSTSNENVAYTAFVNDIRTPILNAISQHRLTIDYIVLTKGIPIRVTSDASGPPTLSGSAHVASVDSLLAVSQGYTAAPNVEFFDQNNILFLKTWENNYWNANQPFSHALYGGFLVTRLDGYTLADAEALVDRALRARWLLGLWVFDIDPDLGSSSHTQPRRITDPDFGDPSFKDGDVNQDMMTAGQLLMADAIPGVLVYNGNFPKPHAFLGNTGNVAGYISWGSNDAAYTRALYNSLSFLPGALAETAVSTSGRTFLDRNAPGQSLIADLIEQGVTGCKGYVFEPYLYAIASPTVLFAHYTAGYNLAEAFYAASRFVGWMDIVVGDPLARIDAIRIARPAPIPIRPLGPPPGHFPGMAR
jgi:uncharacterized protein (TIGR03790 family)